ncbi:hypothetical protein PENTCL1PPCAC_29569 [Pristionchus entomophagus]|uniref:glutathione transferase n=1 Tax=Pristionchus entomophagus TaxID=358040 RepID=A0AAV5UN89_9BILA|nr:hypothetical protein PENTCL1PPCAC_29569 [Pristionchus entomophagus]
MVKYRLIYFNLRARGEVARQLFALAGEPFEDVRVEFDDWFSIVKPLGDMPFDALPVLEVDGEKIAQSITIARFLARTFGFAGKSNYEQAVVDSVADQYSDFFPNVRPFLLTLLGFANHDLDTLLVEKVRPARDEFFAQMTKLLLASESGFLVGHTVTYADLLLAEHVSTFKQYDPHYVRDWPEIQEHWAKVRAIPNLSKWINDRPESVY